VHQGHQPELPPGRLWFGLQLAPSTAPRLSARACGSPAKAMAVSRQI
jgi:hypothetical protein